jgi:tRNA threonylcarbamoyladenosine biosynthesis protein TsaB
MLLAIDTATRSAIDEMLGRSDLSPGDLDGLAVTIGPGSYTGLRVALALAKGLALANTVALVGVPTLDVVAASIGPVADRLIVSAAAGRRRVSAATYEWKKRRWLASSPPITDSWENILATLDDAMTIFAGDIDPAAAKQIRLASKNYRLALPASSVRRAGFLAELGWRALRERRLDDVSKLAPVYLRSPEGS